jgi:hypothetical protein
MYIVRKPGVDESGTTWKARESCDDLIIRLRSYV